MEKRLFGLNTTDLRKMAYQLAVKNRKKCNFNTDKQMASIDWLKGFLKRHLDLSIRKSEAISAARAMGFNKVSVSKFYELLGSIYDKYVQVAKDRSAPSTSRGPRPPAPKTAGKDGAGNSDRPAPRNGRCYLCGGAGHFARQCRRSPQEGGPSK
ncbi:hypothetical protein WH47_10533 [Habropoda laboriosa]|uniref:CCHC-type domain-containing protein n=1 Tax=Habropoda laboriosa TaxID=597456 RepID=A0A0L7QMP0_9HYME|nr:hypothetical protein WH47_10533 [Habropoda laboriosa]